MTIYRDQIKFYFDKLNLTKVHWNIIADDETVHPFTNIDVINGFQNCPRRWSKKHICNSVSNARR